MNRGGVMNKAGWFFCGVLAASLAFASGASANEEEDEHGTSEAAHPDTEGHEGGEHGHHVPSWNDINWGEGLLFESDDAEPGLLSRKPGTPVPVVSMLINSGILFLLLIGLGGPKVREALRARKKSITAGMSQAADMRDEAEERLREYEEKLAKVDQEMDLAKKQIRDLALVERDKVLKEARAKRERMEREARVLIEQELKAARELLMDETVRTAMKVARDLIAQQMSASDEQRLESDYLTSLGEVGQSQRGQA